jgi:hypothetical protein
MTATRVQTFGPKQVYEGHIERYEYYAEAIGNDGRMYYATGRARPTPYVDEQERFRQMAHATLERRMREEGLWSDD